MPKLIFKHIKPNAEILWVLPVSPYHLNCVDQEDIQCVTEGMAVIESTDTPYPGRISTETEIISDTEIKVIYTFDTIENRNNARRLLSFHSKCQWIATKNLPELNHTDYVILSIID